jgi:multisubunit Na+/H+ antiporter MnhF subunit
MLAFDLVAVCGVGVISVLSILGDSADFVELILVYSLLGFLSTAALTRFLHITAERANRESGRDKGRQT